uniref:Reverse transcriptase domain-containing protein n=1 Tax=Haemonchus contortus TaxID=6289 RepID=A0A7I4YDP3_HAECO
MPLCLKFIDLEKIIDTVETEAVIEALGNPVIPTQYVRVLRELYNNFTTRHGMEKHGSEGRQPPFTSSTLCGRHRTYIEQAKRIQPNLTFLVERRCG